LRDLDRLLEPLLALARRRELTSYPAQLGLVVCLSVSMDDRESLLRDSLTEVSLSPVFGTGFASFGRIDPDVGARAVKATNRTTHVYYLTILWKGGVIFFVPYMALMVALWVPAVRRLWAAWREGTGLKVGGSFFCGGPSLPSPSPDHLGFFFVPSAYVRLLHSGAPAEPTVMLSWARFVPRFLFGTRMPGRFFGESHPHSAPRFQRTF
jgi:hypothetical protein